MGHLYHGLPLVYPQWRGEHPDSNAGFGGLEAHGTWLAAVAVFTPLKGHLRSHGHLLNFTSSLVEKYWLIWLCLKIGCLMVFLKINELLMSFSRKHVSMYFRWYPPFSDTPMLIFVGYISHDIPIHIPLNHHVSCLTMVISPNITSLLM